MQSELGFKPVRSVQTVASALYQAESIELLEDDDFKVPAISIRYVTTV